MKKAKQRGTRGEWENEIHKASFQKGNSVLFKELPTLLHQSRQSLPSGLFPPLEQLWDVDLICPSLLQAGSQDSTI